jgi:transcriptional regulator with XRE-family HTH domain
MRKSTFDRRAFYRELGRVITLGRAMANLTQEELGRRLSPPQTRASISNMETGRQALLAHTVVQVAGALGMPPENLLKLANKALTRRPS